LLARLDNDHCVACAAGLRTPQDGFFSESYLDAPVEEVLGEVRGGTVSRDEIFEVSTLASRAPHATTDFIDDIIRFGEASGFAWSFFTLTRRLWLMVNRLGLAPTYLADADHRRITGFERWGSYYEHQPKVYAVCNARLARELRLGARGACNAQAL
jgi:hypothetical protein